jgi:ice-binding like protein
MRLLHNATLILLLSIPSACGDQLVEFGRGPGTGSDNPDAGGTGTGNPPPGACSLAPLALRTAGGMAVLAGSTVTSTGATSVTGDLGVSPGTAVTGFPPGIVVGAQRAGDPPAALAIGDLTTAYNDAAGRTLCPMTVAGNLGGQTLAPGLYKSTSSLEITSGDLTLDAKGNPDAVFLFQMASTLTTTSGRQVVLIGGARASNVFWQVGSSATLGTASVFQGTIMADQSITMAAGATLNGRVLARIAAVSLDSNTIVMPAL